MILTGSEIIHQIKNNNIIIEPFHETQVNPNSYNYRLSKYIAIPEYNEYTLETTYRTIKIPEEGIVLDPHSTYLSHTYEQLGSKEYAMSLIGRSSVGRLGLFLQVDADLGHTSSSHHWTLEIVACKKIRLYPKMIIGQISFWRNYGRYYHSNIRYNRFNFLTTSLD